MDKKEQMKYLRYVEMLTLQEIADEFGVSKQYVHQVVGGSGHKDMGRVRRKTRALEHPEMTNTELAQVLHVSPSAVGDMRRDHYYKLDPRNQGLASHQFGIEILYEKLVSLGMAVDLVAHRHAHDLFVNGMHRVVVSYCKHLRQPPSSLCVSQQWVFGVSQKETDFYAFITRVRDMFIVPVTEVPRKRASVVFCWPTLRPAIGKFQKWYERFDLLEVP